MKYALTLLLLTTLAAEAKDGLLKDSTEAIKTLCKEAIAKKGYRDYKYMYTEISRAQSKNYGMMGELHKEGKRYGYNCFLNKDSKALKIEELAMEEIGK